MPERYRPRRRPAARRPTRPAADGGWDRVATWYDRFVGDEGSDYHREVILPVALRLLEPRPGERVLDLCCGQGVFARALLQYEVAHVLAVDASPRMIEAARSRSDDPRVRYVVRSAAALRELADGSYDAAALIMAAQDVDDLPSVLANVSNALRPAGRVVIVMMHPCFRVPRQSSWGWDEERQAQFRRVDRYSTPMRIPIATHPGRDPSLQTFFHHRPLAEYVNALGSVGLAVVACEEPLTHRRAAPGGRSRGENRAAAEIPVFLALKAVRFGAAARAPRTPDAAAGGASAS